MNFQVKEREISYFVCLGVQACIHTLPPTLPMPSMDKKNGRDYKIQKPNQHSGKFVF